MRIGVFGNGAIGGYLGIELSSAGAEVTLLRRGGSAAGAPETGVRRLDGKRVRADTASLVLSDDPSQLSDVEVCLLTVKSKDSEAAARKLAQVLHPEAVVVSFQNGLRNIERLRAHLGARAVAGIVGYNVSRDENGLRHQASSGKLLAGCGAAQVAVRMRRLGDIFQAAGDPLQLRSDIESLLAGKLLLNLNNGICATTGLGIAASLSSYDGRWCYAQCIREGLAIMRRAGLRPARVAPLPPSWIARLLRLPDAFFQVLASSLVKVDARARSSTLQDLDRGRATEIDDLNGGIVNLAERAQSQAPLNALITALVHEHELRIATGTPPDFVSPSELRKRMSLLMA